MKQTKEIWENKCLDGTGKISISNSNIYLFLETVKGIGATTFKCWLSCRCIITQDRSISEDCLIMQPELLF